MKITMMCLTLDLINRPVFRALIDKGPGWKALVVCLGPVVFELFFEDKE